MIRSEEAGESYSDTSHALQPLPPNPALVTRERQREQQLENAIFGQ